MLSEIDILRLEHGDVDEDCQLLTDDEYQYYIDNYPNKRRRGKAIDMAILAITRMGVRERSGQEEIYANQAFQNVLAHVKLKWKDPAFNGVSAQPMFGGVSKEEMAVNATNPDRVPDTFYKGQYRGVPEWQTQRIYRYIGPSIEPEDCRWYPLWVLV